MGIRYMRITAYIHKMVYYEVNLTIDDEILEDYKKWLKSHIDDMLKIPGFVSYKIYHHSQINGTKIENPQKSQITIIYKLESKEQLEQYFEIYAPKMRGGGTEKFGGKFSAFRRVFEEGQL